MGKPSITNIRPPSKSPDPIWTPPKTNWDLNSSDWDQAVSSGWAATNGGADSAPGGDAAFNSLVGKIDTGAATQEADITGVSNTAMTNDNVVDGVVYDYVFFGVNGGEDETVIGKLNASGVIVTGNGKDNITGGNKADLIFSGNGKDTVNGGGGNDILFGENGPDTLNGGTDEGSATFVPGEDLPPVLVVNDDAGLWDEDPNGTSVDVEVPGKTTVSKEGFFIALDDDGQPTELGVDGNPVVHVIYSITPATDGPYTIAYTHGNSLDGPGNPEFEGPPPSDIAHVTLQAGKTYYFSLIYDAGHETVRVDLFGGHITPTGGNSDPTTVATSQAVPDPGWETFFHEEDGGMTPPTFSFEAGDELIGGNGNDTFVWDGNDTVNVDLIWDYNQSSGTYDATEGDVLQLKNVDPDEALVTFMTDIDGDTVDDLVVYFGEDQAIGLVGITDIAQVDIQYI